MFVVRIETDEALMFRAFRKCQAAKIWASTRCREDDADTLIDVYDMPGIDDAVTAIEAVRDGRAKLLVTGEKLVLQDFRQSATFLAGIGIGTGAGF